MRPLGVARQERFAQSDQRDVALAESERLAAVVAAAPSRAVLRHHAHFGVEELQRQAAELDASSEQLRRERVAESLIGASRCPLDRTTFCAQSGRVDTATRKSAADACGAYGTALAEQEVRCCSRRSKATKSSAGTRRNA